MGGTKMKQYTQFNENNWQDYSILKKELDIIEIRTQEALRILNLSRNETVILKYFVNNNNNLTPAHTIRDNPGSITSHDALWRYDLNKNIMCLRKRNYIEMPEKGLYRLYPDVFEALTVLRK